MTDHPSSLVLERYSVEDLPSSAMDSTKVHVEACADCLKLLHQLQEEHATRMRNVPPEQFLARLERRRLQAIGEKKVWLSAGAALAAVALSVVFIQPEDQVRLKGAGVAVYRRRGDEVRLLRPDQGIRAADALRVVLTLPKRDPAAAYFIDAQGRVDKFFSDGSAVLEMGEHALPGSAVVESPCADLWLVVVTGPEAGVRAQTAFHQAAVNRVPPGPDWAPPNAMVRALRCE